MNPHNGLHEPPDKQEQKVSPKAPADPSKFLSKFPKVHLSLSEWEDLEKEWGNLLEFEEHREQVLSDAIKGAPQEIQEILTQLGLDTENLPEEMPKLHLQGFITDSVEKMFREDVSKINFPPGIDLKTVSMLQATCIQFQVYEVAMQEANGAKLEAFSPGEVVAKVWRLSRLFYRELLRQGGIKPSGS